MITLDDFFFQSFSVLRFFWVGRIYFAPNFFEGYDKNYLIFLLLPTLDERERTGLGLKKKPQ